MATRHSYGAQMEVSVSVDPGLVWESPYFLKLPAEKAPQVLRFASIGTDLSRLRNDLTL